MLIYPLFTRNFTAFCLDRKDVKSTYAFVSSEMLLFWAVKNCDIIMQKTDCYKSNKNKLYAEYEFRI